MKKILSIVTTIIILVGGGFLALLLFKHDVLKYIIYNAVYKYEKVEQPVNNYVKDDIYSFATSATDFYPSDKQEILNVIFTGLNNGWKEFAFYCDYDYTTCEEDVKSVIDNQEVLTTLNNFVNPYNSYDKLYITINGFGKINVSVESLYDEAQITALNKMVDDVISKKIKNTMSTKDKVLTIHDYIINMTKYDEERATAIENGVDLADNYSNIAYGIYSDGKAVCGGYSDLMALFLERLNIPNYKISSPSHVWNYVQVDGSWYHLDLTWDDPVTSNGKDYLMHDFFLITTNQLEKLKVAQHEYDKAVYVEAK